jgi:hypothetical protein
MNNFKIIEFENVKIINRFDLKIIFIKIYKYNFQ